MMNSDLQNGQTQRTPTYKLLSNHPAFKSLKCNSPNSEEKPRMFRGNRNLEGNECSTATAQGMLPPTTDIIISYLTHHTDNQKLMSHSKLSKPPPLIKRRRKSVFTDVNLQSKYSAFPAPIHLPIPITSITHNVEYPKIWKGSSKSEFNVSKGQDPMRKTGDLEIKCNKRISIQEQDIIRRYAMIKNYNATNCQLYGTIEVGDYLGGVCYGYLCWMMLGRKKRYLLIFID